MGTIANTDSTRAFAYLRVSTAEQATNGNGLQVQTDAIRHYCAEHGVDLAAIYRDEGVSGSNGLDDRQGLAEALAALEAGRAGALIVYRLDRLARDLGLQETILARLKRKGIAVISATEDVDSLSDDPTRTLMRQMLGAIGEYERAIIRGRMAGGLAVKRARGGYTGGQPPLGSVVLGHELVADPTEAATVQRIVELRQSGASYRHICSVLTAEGRRPKRGGPWHSAAVRKVYERVAGG